MYKRGLLLCAFLSLGGCWSLLAHLIGERCIYPGTREVWAVANHPKPMASWPFLIDLPFSFALDTVLLPYDLTSFLPEDMGGDPVECSYSGSFTIIK